MSLRRALLLGLILPVWLLTAGCGGADGQRAKELLLQADAAQAELSSSSFAGGVSFALAGRRVQLLYEGAGSKQKGYLSLRSSDLPGIDMTVVVRGEQVWLQANGRWQRLPPAAESRPGSASLGPAAFAELARHVKDVRVRENQIVGGRRVAVVEGAIDTAGLIEALSKLRGVGELGSADVELDEIDGEIGDIEAVLMIDESTHLLSTALVDLSLEAGGETIDLRLSYRLTSSNQPVTIPSPGS